MESKRYGNYFIPVDPFKPSIRFSIKNIWQGRRGAVNDIADDIYSRPVALPLKIKIINPVSITPPPTTHQVPIPAGSSSFFLSDFNTSNDNLAVATHSSPPSRASIHESTSVIPPLNTESHSATTFVLAFILDTVPRQVYLYLLLRLPYMYFSRVTRIFEEAEMSIPQIKQGVLEAAMQIKNPLEQIRTRRSLMTETDFKNLENTWQTFIDSLLREWKTLNIISVLLLSAILTILQIESASRDALTRFSALISMVCALMSLLYGCIYIIRFGTMRKSYKAVEWANEAQKTTQNIMWNVWVLLAMPATWLAWSIILFIVCVISFVWRTGTVEDDSEEPMTRDQVRVARIIVTSVLLLGLVYLALIIATLRRYGEMMDHAWHRRILGWVKDTLGEKVPLVSEEKATLQHVPTTMPPVPSLSSPPIGRRARTWVSNIATPTNHNPIPPREPKHNVVQTEIPATQSKTVTSVDPATAMPSGGLELKSLPRDEHSEQLLPCNKAAESEKRSKSPGFIKILELYHLSPSLGESMDNNRKNLRSSNDKVWESLTPHVWGTFEAALCLSWDAHSPERILPVLDKFNAASADTIGGQVALCQKFTSNESKYAIFFFSFTLPLPQAHNRYDAIPSDLNSLDIWLSPSNSRYSGGIMKVSLPSKDLINTQNTSIIPPLLNLT